MEVYIEFVILDNLIINYILLNLVNLTLKLNAKKSLMLISSLTGMIVAIFLPLITLNNIVLFVIKIFLGLIMVLIIKKPKDFKSFIVEFSLFLTYTFVLGGMCFGVMFMLNTKTSFSGVILYNFEIPVSLFILLGLFYLKFMIKLIKTIRKKFTFNNFYYDVKVTNNNISLYLNGFLDSGNQLECDGTGVMVINYASFLKLYPNIDYQKLIMGNLQNCGLKNAKFINVGSAANTGKMLIFNVDELEVITNNKTVKLNNAKLGLSKSRFNSDFDCLLSPLAISQGELNV